MALKPEVKTRWVKALRSGRYDQARNALKKKSAYCCLGVLCDVVKEDLNLDWQIHPQTGLTVFDKHYGTLPDSVKQFASILQEECGSLMRMNDDEDKNFNEIADYIEKNL